MQWIAEFSDDIVQDGFRFPVALRTRNGAWITEDGWTAWTLVAGHHATAADVPACIEGILAFHRALADLPQHPFMRGNMTAWGQADRWCWGDKPGGIQPQLRPYVDELYALRKPVDGLDEQLIHGDLNPENILIAPGLPPAFLDLSPFWRPVEFALGMFANWIGPRRGDPTVLRHFQQVRAFDQMLIRAGIRMLLVMAVLNGLDDDWESCPEKQAAELILDYVRGRAG